MLLLLDSCPTSDFDGLTILAPQFTNDIILLKISQLSVKAFSLVTPFDDKASRYLFLLKGWCAFVTKISANKDKQLLQNERQKLKYIGNRKTTIKIYGVARIIISWRHSAETKCIWQNTCGIFLVQCIIDSCI